MNVCLNVALAIQLLRTSVVPLTLVIDSIRITFLQSDSFDSSGSLIAMLLVSPYVMHHTIPDTLGISFEDQSSNIVSQNNSMPISLFLFTAQVE